MLLSDDPLICAASDLAGLLACGRLTALGLRAPRGEVERPEKARSLTAAHGDRHERRYLDAMKGPRPAAGSERACGRPDQLQRRRRHRPAISRIAQPIVPPKLPA